MAILKNLLFELNWRWKKMSFLKKVRYFDNRATSLHFLVNFDFSNTYIPLLRPPSFLNKYNDTVQRYSTTMPTTTIQYNDTVQRYSTTMPTTTIQYNDTVQRYSTTMPTTTIQYNDAYYNDTVTFILSRVD